MSTNNNNLGASGGMKSAAAAAFGMSRPDDSAPPPTEDLPPMRAVALMTQAHTLQFAAPPSGPKFGNSSPLGVSRPPTLGGKRSISAGIAVKQEWNESNWEVCDLEQVPLDFPLERTHREINGCDASEVAKRISNTLRLLSVQAEYDGEKAKCTTSDMVSFRIRLFSGGEEGLPVVVEVQRRSGSPSSFVRVARKILDGAEGAEIPAVTIPARKMMPPFVKCPIGEMKCLRSAAPIDPDAQLKSGLDKSIALLRCNQKDSSILGLENLCLLTDPLKTCPAVALKACKAIIVGNECSDIREEVAVMLQKDAFLPEEFDEEALHPLIEKTRHMALILMSNTLVLTSKDGTLAAAVEEDKWFSDFVIPTLLDEVRNFETGSNNAYEAACGITSLATCSGIARRLMKENAALDDIEAAYRFGLNNHELLANESERALGALRRSV